MFYQASHKQREQAVQFIFSRQPGDICQQSQQQQMTPTDTRNLLIEILHEEQAYSHSRKVTTTGTVIGKSSQLKIILQRHMRWGTGHHNSGFMYMSVCVWMNVGVRVCVETS